jgi:hypothetical protein
MANENIFEVATRRKFRFPFRGSVSVEDLWDLTPENLDTIFKTLNSQKKRVNEESLLSTSTNEDVELNMMIAIVKHIVNVKLDEINARNKAKAKREQQQKILSILNAKEDEALQNKSIDELQAMLADLD